MTPSPLNPKVVLQLDHEGRVINNKSNIGSDLIIVVTQGSIDFEKESKGVPYTGTTCRTHENLIV